MKICKDNMNKIRENIEGQYDKSSTNIYDYKKEEANEIIEKNVIEENEKILKDKLKKTFELQK